MSDSVESQAKTVDEAISEALLRLGARRDEVEIEVLEEPRSGLFGFLGGRSAKVLVKRKGRSSSRSRGSRGRGRSRGRGGGEAAKTEAPARTAPQQKPRGSERSGGPSKSTTKPQAASTRKTNAPADKVSERNQTDSSRRRRRPRRRKPAASETTANETMANETMANKTTANDQPTPRSKQPSVADAGPERSHPAAAVVREKETPPDDRAAPPKGIAEEAFAEDDPGRMIITEVKAAEHAEAIRDIDDAGVPDLLHDLATKLMRFGDFPCRCEIVPDDYTLVKVITDDRSAGLLIGRHGATVDSVEHLVERMATQAHGDRVRMNLDINNYRRKREATLIELTGEALAEVRQSGNEVHTDPLCARERRIVHLEVKKASGMKSFTMMSGDGKYVVMAIDDGEATEPDTDLATAGDEQVATETVDTDTESSTDR